MHDDRPSAGVQGSGLRVRWLGRVPYAEAWDLQRAVAARSDDDYLLLMEHAPVYTLGSHADPSHVLVEPATVGAILLPVDRGGDVHLLEEVGHLAEVGDEDEAAHPRIE